MRHLPSWQSRAAAPGRRNGSLPAHLALGFSSGNQTFPASVRSWCSRIVASVHPKFSQICPGRWSEILAAREPLPPGFPYPFRRVFHGSFTHDVAFNLAGFLLKLTLRLVEFTLTRLLWIPR